MSYQVLARKWRPQQFSDMIGQDHVVKALCNALDNDRLHHAYLFTGMRGVGKTTIARVFAKSLNCETNGVSSTPCGQCATCLDIEAGRFFDLIEVDAASRTGVDDTRELLENVPYAPSSGRFKVYLIDEVHMFSKSSFNALLKTLEEPPEHVKFILATTDPQKVPVTVLSRCLQFNLKAMPESVLVEYLGRLLDTEKIEWEPAALVHIARASEGSVRDSLSLVEQAAAYGGGRVNAAEVESMLGRLSPARLLDLLEAIASLNAAETLSQVAGLAEYSPDYAQILSELLASLHQVALVQSMGGQSAGKGLDSERIEKLAKTIDAADVQLFYQIGLHGRRDMPYAPDPRGALEMCLLRMLAFRPVADQPAAQAAAAPGNPSAEPSPGESNSATAQAVAPALTADVAGQGQSGSENIAPAPSSGPALLRMALDQPPDPRPPDPRPPDPRPPDPRPPDPRPPDPRPEKPGTAPTSQARNAVPQNQRQPAVKPAVAAPEKAATAESVSASPAITLAWTAPNWSAIVTQLGVTGMAMQLASNCTLLSLDKDNLVLALNPELAHLNIQRTAERLQERVSTARGRKTNLSFETVAGELDTPVNQQVRKEQDALASAQDAIRQDPVVQALVDKVDGTVVESSVKPI